MRLILVSAQLNGTFLHLTQLNKAKLFQAQFNEADLAKAELNNADLNEIQLNEVELDKTQLNEANSVNKAALRGSSVKNMDFSHVSISREKLHEMFGDASVILPDTLQPPPPIGQLSYSNGAIFTPNGKNGWPILMGMSLTLRSMGRNTPTRRGRDSPYPFGVTWCIKRPLIH